MSIISTLWNNFVGLFEYLLLAMFDLTHSSGLSIILVATIVRVVTLPITYQSLVKMRGMQELQPKLKELQRFYDLERQKLRQETAKLYKEYRTSPFAGGLLLILQFPIIFGIYQAVTNLTLASAPRRLDGSFLWLNDLGQVDPFWILPILVTVTQLSLQLMAQPTHPDSFQKMLGYLSLPIPFMFGVISLSFPSGAVLYWFVDELFLILAQYLVSGWGALTRYLPFGSIDQQRRSMPATAAVGTASAASQDES